MYGKSTAMAVLAAMSLTGSAWAADDVVQLNPVVVTAQRMEVDDLQTPAAVTVITGEEIKKTGANTVFDALSFVPGITNFSYGPGGMDYGMMDSRVNIRGLERGALILVDGVPLNLNGKNTLDDIPMSVVEKIEVLKGSASILYGADALSGAVNIITRKTQEPSTEISVGIGNVGHQVYRFSHGDDQFRFSVAKEFFGAQSQTSPIRWDRGYFNDRAKSSKLNYSFSAQLTDELHLKYLRSKADSTYGQINISDDPQKKWKQSKQWHYNDVKQNISLGYENEDIEATLFYLDRKLYGEGRNLHDLVYSPNASNFKSIKYGVDVLKRFELSDSNVLTIGLSGINEKYSGESKENKDVHADRQSYALYGQLVHDFSPEVSSILGVRYQRIQDPIKNQNVFTPQWQLLYRLQDDASVYLNVGKSFTMPSLSDAFKKVDGKYSAITGKNLKPEEGWNYEVGYKKVTDKDSLKIAVYHMRFKNFFGWKKAHDATGKQYDIRINQGEFLNTGVEVEYKRMISDRFNVDLGASFSNPKNQKTPGGKWEQTYPKVQLVAGMSYSTHKWNAGLHLNYWTKRLKNRDGGTNPDMISLNMSGEYHIGPNDSCFLQINNILDRHNVITNGAWEYWDLPFNFTLTYQHKF